MSLKEYQNYIVSQFANNYRASEFDDISMSLSSRASMEIQTGFQSPMLIKQSSLLLKKMQEDNTFSSASKQPSESFINMKFTQVLKTDRLESFSDESFPDEDRVKPLIIYAEYIKLKGALFGEIIITEKDFTFNSLEGTRPSGPEYTFGSIVMKCLIDR